MKSATAKETAKGQKSIAAFFGAPKRSAASKPSPDTPAGASACEASLAPAASSPAAAEPNKRTAGAKESGSAQCSAPAAKRARTTPSNEQTAQHTEQAHASPSVAVDLTDADDVAPQPTPNGTAQPAGPARAFQRDPARHALARRKLAVKRERMVLGADGSHKLEKGAKYTPLERQVMDLKKRNPGKVLLIEVRPS